MDVSGELSIKAKHHLIAVQFRKWFLYLDSVGIFAFGLFLGSLGAEGIKLDTHPYKHDGLTIVLHPEHFPLHE